MRWVRASLLAAWFVLIALLIHDPITPAWTAADNLASPFRIGEATVLVQGKPLPSEPYSMANRMFWTMVLPCVPLLLMLFGHEFWRRICPLSLVSQLPRLFGIERKVRKLNRASGRVDRVLALLPSTSWLRRNHLLLQFGFLSVGVLCRLLFYNSDRTALVIAFLGLMGLALAVGLAYGGKTWCNYVCPTAIIQGIYTGPGGLLDSKAHVSKSPLGQSVCRTPTADGDRSVCVGCTSHCPDVDLENAYWKSVESDQKRFVYYGFFGLVFAFYTYYYVYSGGWDYYMTGAWTHEPDQLSQLLAPGFYLGGHAVPIPKVLAAPLYFVVCIGLAYGLFLGIERLVDRTARWRGHVLSKPVLRHTMLSVSAFLSFNLFYVFAGRPNIFLMPPWAMKLIDVAIVLVSTIWLVRSLARSVERYRKESLGTTLRIQLVRMGFKSEDLLEGRSIDTLSADEVYVLARTLPNLSVAQKREAYRNILAEALASGQAQSSDSLRTLADLRAQLGLTPADHQAVVAALGIEDPTLFDPEVAQSTELRLRRDNYRQFLADLVQRGLEAGRPPRESLELPDAVMAIRPVRALYDITDEEHARVVAELTADESRHRDGARAVLKALLELEVQRFSLLGEQRPEAVLLRHALMLKQRDLLRPLAMHLAEVQDEAERRRIGQALHAYLGEQARDAIADAVESSPEALREALLHPVHAPGGASYLDVVGRIGAPEAVYRELASDIHPTVASLAWMALTGQPPKDAVVVMAELLAVDAFSLLDTDALGAIAARTELRSCRQGELLCREGEDPSSMFVLVEGETSTWIQGEHGPSELGRSGPGAVFGELGVITGRPRSASISVTSPAARVLAIPREVVDQLLSSDARATRGILNVVSGYLQDRLAAARRAPETADTTPRSESWPLREAPLS